MEEKMIEAEEREEKQVKEEIRFPFHFFGSFLFLFLLIVLVIVGSTFYFENFISQEEETTLVCRLEVGQYCVDLPENMNFKLLDGKVVLRNSESRFVAVLEAVSGDYFYFASNLGSLEEKYFSIGYQNVSSGILEYEGLSFIDFNFSYKEKFGKTLFLKDSDKGILSVVVVADSIFHLEEGKNFILSVLKKIDLDQVKI